MTEYLKKYWTDEDGVATIESAFAIPIIISLFFCCLQVVILMLNQTTMKNGVETVIASYEEMYIKNQSTLTETDVKDMICKKMLVGDACKKRISVQLYSYSNSGISNLKNSGENNTWSELEKYYVSFVRVDYRVPNIIPYFSTVMRSPDKEYTISTVFVVSPGKMRTGLVAV